MIKIYSKISEKVTKICKNDNQKNKLYFQEIFDE